MCTALPVFRGEIQCRLLGMAVEAFTPKGTAASPDEAGELVCLKPFPCMPAGFWPLPGYGAPDAVAAAQKRYQDAYFSEFKGVWCKFRTGFGLTRPRSRRRRFLLTRSACFRLPALTLPVPRGRRTPPRSVHGDHIVITRSRAGNGGGLVMLGRSDGVLCVSSSSGLRLRFSPAARSAQGSLTKRTHQESGRRSVRVS